MAATTRKSERIELTQFACETTQLFEECKTGQICQTAENCNYKLIPCYVLHGQFLSRVTELTGIILCFSS